MARNHSPPESEEQMAPRHRGHDQPHDHPIDVDHEEDDEKIERSRQSVFVREKKV